MSKLRSFQNAGIFPKPFLTTCYPITPYYRPPFALTILSATPPHPSRQPPSSRRALAAPLPSSLALPTISLRSPPVTILPPSSLCQPLSPTTPLTHPSQPPGDNLCHLPTAAHVPAPDVRRRLTSAWPLWAGNGCPSLNCILTPEL